MTMHQSLSASYETQLSLDSTHRKSRLTALVTKYYSPVGRLEVPGWREMSESSESELSIQTTRPYTIRTRGQWTSQPRYPHVKLKTSATVSHLHQSLSPVQRTPLIPTLRELSLEHKSSPDQSFLHLPPLRRLDNSDSHHSHPAKLDLPLLVIAENNEFTSKKPRDRKMNRRGRLRAFNSPVEATRVRFQEGNRVVCGDMEGEEVPVEEKIVVSVMVKRVIAPEKRIRPGRSIQSYRCDQPVPKPTDPTTNPSPALSNQNEESLFVYTEDGVSPSIDHDNSGLFVSMHDQASPFPELEPSPTQVDDPIYTPEMTSILYTKVTPVEESIPLITEDSHPSKDTLTVAVEPNTEENPGKGLKWTSVSTMENTLGQEEYRPNVETEATQGYTLGTEEDLDTSENPNMQILDCITPPPHSDYLQDDIPLETPLSKPEIILPEPASTVITETVTEEIPTPDCTPRRARADSFPLNQSLEEGKVIIGSDAKPPTGLTEEQINEMDLRGRNTGNKKKISVLTQPELVVDGEGRSPRPEKRSLKTPRRMSVGSPHTKKPKPTSKPAPKPDVLDLKRDAPRPLDVEVTTIPTPDLEDCGIIQEQAGEESDEDASGVHQPPQHSIDQVPTEEVKPTVAGLLQPRRSSTYVPDSRVRRGSMQDQSGDDAQSRSFTIIEEENDDATRPRKGAIKKKKRSGRGNSGTRRLPSKKTPAAPPASIQTNRAVSMTEESVGTWRHGDSNVSGIPEKHSAHSSLTSSDESDGLSEDADDTSPNKRSDSTKRPKRSKPKSKPTDTRFPRKRNSIISSDFSEHGGEQDSPMLPRNPADEVFVRHFAINMIAFMQSVSQKKSSAVTRGFVQLNKARKMVLSINYGPIYGETSRRASLLPRRRTSTINIARTARFRKSITAVALSGFKENLDRALNPSEDTDSDDPESSPDPRISRFSRADFEIKHLAMLKNLALKLLNLGQEEKEEKEEVEEMKPGEVWAMQYSEQQEAVGHRLEMMFKDFKTPPITAFTSIVTNFFKDPHSARAVFDDTSDLDHIETDPSNYRESLERRKFLEYSRQFSAYAALRRSQPDSFHQVTNERLNPIELTRYFKDLYLKRKKRREVMEMRQGELPVVICAKPRKTHTGLPLEYYTMMVRKARQVEFPTDVVLSGGAHRVKSEEEYRERLYCRIKREENLQKFS